MSSSPSRGAMAVSQAVTVFRLQMAWKGMSDNVDRSQEEAGTHSPHPHQHHHYQRP